MIYRFSTFSLIEAERILVRDNQGVHISSLEFNLLLCLVVKAPQLVKKEEIKSAGWSPEEFVDDGTLQKHVSNLNKLLGGRIRNVRKHGYRLECEVRRVDEVEPKSASSSSRLQRTSAHAELASLFAQTMNGALRPSPEVAEFLDSKNWVPHCIDEFIEIERAPAWRGWRSKDVSFDCCGPYSPPPQLGELKKKYAPDGASNLLYGLSGLSQHKPFADSTPRLSVKVVEGSYHDVHVLNRMDKSEKDRAFFRNKFQDKCLPIEDSPLWHNVNCQVLLVSADRQIVLGKRHKGMGVAAGLWSATVEEQMLREHRITKLRDAGLFECGQRGVKEELGVEIELRNLILLSVGIEWRNFAAAFLFVGACEETFEEVVQAWIKAGDPYEAVALDCVPAEVETIWNALLQDTWTPTSRAKSRFGLPKEPTGWHHTSRARLYAYLRYLEEVGCKN